MNQDGEIYTAFTNALSAFQKNRAYWVLGHGFDTMLDCLSICRPTDLENKQWLYVAEEALHKLRRFPEDPPQPPKPNSQTDTFYAEGESWYDDSGWWVLASLKAYTFAQDIGWSEYSGMFRDFCLEKWHRYLAAEDAYTASNAQKACPQERPLFDGGVWNSTWPQAPGDQNAGGNCDRNLGGYQNTVTNTLFLAAAERLALTARADGKFPDKGYAASADGEFVFLQRWFAPGYPNVYPLLNRYEDGVPGRAVVRERVHAFHPRIDEYKNKPLDDTDGTSSGFNKDQAWAGDQGILIGGLLARAQRTGAEALRNSAKEIFRGVADKLVSQVSGNRALVSWPAGPGAPGGAKDAYSTGFGAFLRYFTDAYRGDPEMRAFLDTPQSGGTGWTDGFSSFVLEMMGNFENDSGYRAALLAQWEPGGDLTVAINELALRVAARAITSTKRKS